VDTRAQSDTNGAAEPDPAEAGPLAKELGLRRASADTLTIRRIRRGRGFAYLDTNGICIRDRRLTRRLASLAVPPAYQDVRYSRSASAHLQAIARDAAGRLQYRYHPDWEQIREHRKAQRLLRLVDTLPRIRAAVTRHLAAPEPNREFALAAAIDLVAATAIRAGSEEYARERGTRGAATLLKANVTVTGDAVRLCFRGKGGKRIEKELQAPRLAAAIETLRELPGRRLFQYRDEAGAVHSISARDVNAFLQAIADCRISLKDFRTLCACARVLDHLARTSPADSARARKRQVIEAIREAATDLANTPAICRKSYVHAVVLDAFETGTLEKYAATLKRARGPARREKLVARVLAAQIG
jgi:DNA topoisomerase-1